MQNKKHIRSKILIDPKFQISYITFNILFLIFFAMVIIGGLYLGMWRSITREFSSIRLQDELNTLVRFRQYQTKDFQSTIERVPFLKEDAQILSERQRKVLNSIILRTNQKLIPLILVLVFFATIAGIILSHRIAGPVYRFRKNLESASKGDLRSSFNIRYKDELHELSKDLDRTFTEFSKRINIINNYLDKAIEKNSNEDIKSYIYKAKEALEFFKTKEL